jgi:DNA (cytosine-5)-methyltransferase 1
MKIGSLFSGIGGLDLGIEKGLSKYGAETVWQVEMDKHCVSVLKKHWPNALQIEDDINNVDFSKLEKVDMLIGGFPCQTFSVAGSRKGLSEEDDRGILWYQFERAISTIRPEWVVAENVRGLLTAKDDQGRKGGAFARVVSFLASRGYRVEWQVISAGSVNAPHLRERVFVVAKKEEMGNTNSKSNVATSREITREPQERNTRQNNARKRSRGTKSRTYWQEIEQQMGSISYGICPGLAGNLGLPNYWDYYADRINWPTPTATQIERSNLVISEKNPNRFVHKDGKTYPMNLTEKVKSVEKEIWATPTTQDTPHKDIELTESGRRKSKDGKSSHSLNLQDQVNLSEKTTFSTPLKKTGDHTDTPSEWRRNSHNIVVQSHYKEYEPWETVPRAVEDYPLRKQKLQALGNAVVPACAEFVGLCISRSIDKNTIVFDQNIKNETIRDN